MQVARLRPDGSPDTTFVSRSEIGAVQSIVPLPAGAMLVSGAGPIHRLAADGAIDRAYVSPVLEVDGAVRMAMTVDGAVYIGGSLKLATSRSFLLRVAPSGAVAGVSGVPGPVLALVAASDGSLFAAHTTGVVRVLPSGAVDTTFSAGPLNGSAVNALAVDTVGRLLGATASQVIRLPGSGETASAYPVPAAGALLPLADGSLWVGGSFSGAGTVAAEALVRFSPVGFAAIPVGTNVERPGLIHTVIPAANGGVVVAGDFRRLNREPVNRLARLDAKGAIDPTFAIGAGPSGPVRQVQALPDGRWLVAGGFAAFGGEPRAGLARLSANGALDASFVPKFPAGSSVRIDGAVPVPAERYVAYGALSGVQGDSLAPVFRLLADGSHDPTFRLDVARETASVAAVAALRDGRVVAVGRFREFGRTVAGNVVALRSDGSVDPSYSPGSSYDVPPDGDADPFGPLMSIPYRSMLVGGRFASRVNGNVFSALAASEAGVAWQSIYQPENTGPLRGVLRSGGDGVVAWHDGETISAAGSFPRLLRISLRGGTRDRSFALLGVSPLARFSTAAVDDEGRLYVAASDSGRLRRTQGATPPSLVRAPRGAAVRRGSVASVSVVVAGVPAPTLQWFKEGRPIPGATSSEYSVSPAGDADSGTYRVSLANPAGELWTLPIALVVDEEPRITTQPAGLSVVPGARAVLTVSATSATPLSFQWRKGGAPVTGATASSLIVAATAAAHESDYDVLVTNALGTTASAVARLSVVPVNASVQMLRAGYVAGEFADFRVAITFGRPSSNLSWRMVLPAGWVFQSDTATTAATRPTAGATGFAEWMWAPLSEGVIAFDFRLRVPADQTGRVAPDFRLEMVPAGAGPLVLSPTVSGGGLVPLDRHDADSDGDRRIGLAELTRVIALFNVRRGALRTGAYGPAASPSEDGFMPAPARVGSELLARYHSADSNHDGRFDLVEITRVIELFNWRDNSVRTGAYRVAAGTEDGFAPGR